jgi:hypothetical protein
LGVHPSADAQSKKVLANMNPQPEGAEYGNVNQGQPLSSAASIKLTVAKKEGQMNSTVGMSK